MASHDPLSMTSPKQEYWSGLTFVSPSDLSHPGMEPTSPALAGRFLTTEPPGIVTGKGGVWGRFKHTHTFYFVLEYSRLIML